jgi:hypothetical protein
MYGSVVTGFGPVAAMNGAKVIGIGIVKDTDGQMDIGRLPTEDGNGFPVIGAGIRISG